MTTQVVFDMEDPAGPMPLGIYERTDEDVVIYRSSHAGFRAAPCDCVQVIAVHVYATHACAKPADAASDPVARANDPWRGVKRTVGHSVRA